MDALADRILALKSSHSLAYSAKANAALARGNVLAMIQNKEQAISCARYATAEYCDYFQKLYTVHQLYLQAGDSGSAAYCREKLLAIPDMIAAVSARTDPLAFRTGNDSVLELPEAYLAVLDTLS